MAVNDLDRHGVHGIKDQMVRICDQHDKMSAFIEERFGGSMLFAVWSGPHPSQRARDSETATLHGIISRQTGFDTSMAESK